MADDEEFDFDDNYGSDKEGRQVADKHHDEEYSLPEDGPDMPTPEQSTASVVNRGGGQQQQQQQQQQHAQRRGDSPPNSGDSEDDHSYHSYGDDEDAPKNAQLLIQQQKLQQQQKPPAAAPTTGAKAAPQQKAPAFKASAHAQDDEDEDDEDEDGEDDEDEDSEDDGGRNANNNRNNNNNNVANNSNKNSNNAGNNKKVAGGVGGGSGGGGGSASAAASKPTGYNPAKFANVKISNEIKELFDYITRYKPQTIELPTKLKPFIPEYIPAVGDIDAFLKIPRPDGKPDTLGLAVLDEPSSKQSDEAVFELHLRALSKQAGVVQTTVGTLKNAEKNQQAIGAWIKSINELHRSKPTTQIHYTKPMPEIDDLMQEWPPEVEQLLNTLSFPGGDIDMDVKEYCKIVCALLDIPVYPDESAGGAGVKKGDGTSNHLIQALHMLLTLYTDFKSNQHFQHQSSAMPDNNNINNNNNHNNVKNQALPVSPSDQ